MKRTVHLLAGLVAISMIAAFFLSTLLVELLGSAAAIATVKRLIVFPGVFLLGLNLRDGLRLSGRLAGGTRAVPHVR
jgi:hypothetical protein